MMDWARFVCLYDFMYSVAGGPSLNTNYSEALLWLIVPVVFGDIVHISCLRAIIQVIRLFVAEIVCHLRCFNRTGSSSTQVWTKRDVESHSWLQSSGAPEETLLQRYATGWQLACGRI